jgi:hypothetical protein
MTLAQRMLLTPVTLLVVHAAGGASEHLPTSSSGSFPSAKSRSSGLYVSLYWWRCKPNVRMQVHVMDDGFFLPMHQMNRLNWKQTQRPTIDTELY